MKILKLPHSQPEKFGPKRAQKRRKKLEKQGQLDLFSGGRILQLHPHSTFERALKLDEQGDYEAAREMYRQAIEKGEAVADAYCNLGIIESTEGRFAEAVHCLTQCLKHDPHHYEAHFNLGNTYGEAKDYELAKLHYRICIEMEPAFLNSYFNLALILAMTHQYGEAIKLLSTYRQLASGDEQKAAVELIKKLQLLL